MVDCKQGCLRLDLLKIIQNRSADTNERTLALSQYIDHLKFNYTSKNPRPTDEEDIEGGKIEAWENRLYRYIRERLNANNIYPPAKLLKITKKSAHTLQWTASLARDADNRLGEVISFHPLDYSDDEVESAVAVSEAAETEASSPSPRTEAATIRQPLIAGYRIPRRTEAQEKTPEPLTAPSLSEQQLSWEDEIPPTAAYSSLFEDFSDTEFPD